VSGRPAWGMRAAGGGLRRPWPLALAALLLTAAVEAGEIRRGLKAPSPALGRVVPYSLYLPDGYGASAQRYPVLFLLHGLGGSEADWVTAGALGPTLDRLIAERAVPPMVVVAPGFGDSWYVDNPDRGGFGAAESAFLGDLVQHVDRTWSTAGRRTGRAVAGLSMGGWGAMRFAMLRPDLFVAAAGLSAAIVTADQATTEPWRGWFTGVFGTPFDPARFRAASPLALVPRLAAADPRPALFLTCGDDDELGLEEGSVLLHRALERAGIASELRVTDGGHGWAVWARELDPVLRFVGTALAGP
jgi:S-formylglutathione hydrolase FrmB